MDLRYRSASVSVGLRESKKVVFAAAWEMSGFVKNQILFLSSSSPDKKREKEREKNRIFYLSLSFLP